MNQDVLRLIRIATSKEHGTFGCLTINNNPFCITLEPSKWQNEKNISCIPTGQYTCEKYSSPRFPNTFEITGVEGRSHILFHSGNLKNHSRGCVLLGEHFGKLQGENFAILNSGATFEKFMKITKNSSSLLLTITESY